MALHADLDQMFLEEHRHAAGDNPAVLLVDHAGDVRREYLLRRPAQHLLARQAVIVLAGAVEQDVAGILRAFREHGNRNVLDDGIEEFLGPQQILLDLIGRVGACLDNPLAVAIAGLIGRADELAQLGEINLSGLIGGAAKLLDEQAVHAQTIA